MSPAFDIDRPHDGQNRLPSGADCWQAMQRTAAL
jgi:hypothetical protein